MLEQGLLRQMGLASKAKLNGDVLIQAEWKFRSKIKARDTLLCSEPHSWSDMPAESEACNTHVRQLQILVFNHHLQHRQ